MRLLTETATLQCLHGAMLQVSATQRFVTIDGQAVLVRPAPVGGAFAGCLNTNAQAGQKPCITPMPPTSGYSALVSINGMAACTEVLQGITDSTPPGTYSAVQAGQIYVSAGI
jgi:hypothetical protein